MPGYFSRVPIELDHGRPVVQVKVNGRGPFRFAISTDVDMVAMSTTLMDSLGLWPRQSADSITFGSVRLDSVRLMQILPGDGVVGLLGLRRSRAC
jgi:hypothetical protein